MSKRRPTSYQVMIKPYGSICNLGCRYCFYLEKKSLYKNASSFRMSSDLLDSFIRQYIETQNTPEIQFAWQGGEPTLLGVDFFRTVLTLQAKHAGGKKISNSVQTNGTLLNDEWCEFLSSHDFLVGLSIDGPQELHDHYRKDKSGKPSFDAVMQGIRHMKKHGTKFNTLTVINDKNSQHPLEVYRFLKEVGDGFMQFIPVVERKPDKAARSLGLELSAPSVPAKANNTSPLTPWSVKPKDFGEFYVQIFDEWIRQDVGTVFVQFFDVALGNWLGAGSGLCQFSPMCGNAGALEHNGDLYPCDHYVYPQYKLGNILKQPLHELMNSDKQHTFGNDKLERLPEYCRECEVLFACHGDCPKHRFAITPDGDPELSYLCPAYRRIFTHMDPYMNVMKQLLRSGRLASDVMEIVKTEDRHNEFAVVKRNDPCPCDSGSKYKKCCGAWSGKSEKAVKKGPNKVMQNLQC